MRHLIALGAIALATASFAQTTPPTPLIVHGPIEVTSEDFEAFLLKIPPMYRPEVRASLENIGKIADQVYGNRVLAAEARKMGLDRDPRVQLRMKQIEEAYLATLWNDKFRENVKTPDLSKRAEELYQMNRSKYVEPERFTGHFLLVSFNGRTRASALEYANALRDRAAKGDDFPSLVASFSEDPLVRRNRGRFEAVSAAEMEKAIADAAFALKKKGDITAPIETPVGFLLVQMDAKTPGFTRPFADVKESIVLDESTKLRDNAADREIDRLKNTPQTVVHTKNIEALRRDVDREELDRMHRARAATPPAAPRREETR